MIDNTSAPLLRLANAAIKFRRSKEAFDNRGPGSTPMRPELWLELCASLDALVISGVKNEIERTQQANVELLDACKLAVAVIGPMDAARHIQEIIDRVEKS